MVAVLANRTAKINAHVRLASIEQQDVGGLVLAVRNVNLTVQAIGSRMRTLSGRTGLRRLTVYGYRQGFATEALAKGVPDATVAALLGHSDTSMLHRHYGQLTSRTAALKDAVGKVW